MEKIIFTDIDETIKVKHKPLTSFCNDVIRTIQNQGIMVVPVTGRDITRAEDIIANYGGSKYLITSNGANIFDAELKQPIFEKKMDKSSVLELYKFAIKNGFKVLLNVNGEVCFSSKKQLDLAEKYIENITDVLAKYDVYQMVIQGITNKKFDKIKAKIACIENIKIANTCGEDNNHSLDVVDKYVDKGIAVKFLLKQLNIKPNQAIVFGNDFNDLPMFLVVDNNYCVENASDNIKQIASHTIDSVYYDGVAKFLNKKFKLNVNKD